MYRIYPLDQLPQGRFILQDMYAKYNCVTLCMHMCMLEAPYVHVRIHTRHYTGRLCTGFEWDLRVSHWSTT